MFISDSVKYIGVNDRKVDLFEGQYVVSNGISYNSYAIIDEKIAIMDTVDANFLDEWLANIEKALAGRTPDYLVVLHMEPDHSANIHNFIKAYPNAKVVSSGLAFEMMKNFFGTDFADNRIVVDEGSTLELGEHTLAFVKAPMVHWPEVIMAYETNEKVLFSADGFGKFGALDVEEDWASEARRYYIGIVGKYGMPVQAVLKKAAGLDIQTICPLHGPVLKENLGYYLGLYNAWSSYTPEDDDIVIAYTSVYGNTKKAVELLAESLTSKGCNVVVHDLARCDIHAVIADAFKSSKLVLATTTYNGDIFPYMRSYIDHLVGRAYQNRTVALIENGTWAPLAAKVMKGMLEKCKKLTFAENSIKITSALNEESKAQIAVLADELASK